MFAPEKLTPDEKHIIKWAFIGAFITAGVAALCDLAKTEMAGWLARRRDAVKK